MKQHLFWSSSLNKMDTAQTGALNITTTMETENEDEDECVVGNRLHTNDLVKLFDYPDMVFKDWNFFSIYTPI